MRRTVANIPAVLPVIARTQALVGRADQVRDGDTKAVSGMPIRRHGFVAPAPR
jgi:hypothetical protein